LQKKRNYLHQPTRLKVTIKNLFTLILLNASALSFVAPSSLAQIPENKEVRKNKDQKEEKGSGNKRKTDMPIANGNLVLGTPTATSITANILLQNSGEAFMEYSTIQGRYNRKTILFKSQDLQPIEIILENLIPSTTYYYRLNYRLAGEKDFKQSPQSWFSTQKKSDASFSFGVQGDSHPEREGKMFSPALYSQTLDSVSAKKPDFYFMLGDDFSIDHLIERGEANKANIDKVYQLQRAYLGNAGKNPPLFLVNGNHEQAARYLLDGTENSPAVLAANARKKYFPLPDPGNFYTGDMENVTHVGVLKDYYAFEWGNALFVTIDPYWHSDSAVDNQAGQNKKGKRNLWDITLGETQYKWLKQTLEKSKAKYKFVFSHHVLGTGRGGVERAKYFEWGGNGQNGVWDFDKQRPGWDLPIHQLMVKNKVTIFFQGHDHIFARQELDGVIYQSVPNPADDSYTAFNREAYTSGDILANSGFLHVSVSATQVKVDYIRSYLKDSPALTDEAKKTFSYIIK
jgi:hypothetical protein